MKGKKPELFARHLVHLFTARDIQLDITPFYHVDIRLVIFLLLEVVAEVLDNKTLASKILQKLMEEVTTPLVLKELLRKTIALCLIMRELNSSIFQFVLKQLKLL